MPLKAKELLSGLDRYLHVDAVSDALRDNAEVFEYGQASFHAVSVLLIHRGSDYVHL
jgi:hypothetical protein